MCVWPGGQKPKVFHWLWARGGQKPKVFQWVLGPAGHIPRPPPGEMEKVEVEVRKMKILVGRDPAGAVGSLERAHPRKIRKPTL